MSDELVVRHCAPTLASLKAGSLFGCCYKKQEEMKDAVRSMNHRLSGLGLRIIPLRYTNGRALIYVYRPRLLSEALEDQDACRLLRENGYRCSRPEQCLIHLIDRLRDSEEFPHEIGLFLGYPPADVDGFIHRHDECIFTGTWKVYADVEHAKQLFEQYRQCTDRCLHCLANGKTLESMATPA